MSATIEPPVSHVSVAATVCGGRPCITGTRIRVSDIASIVLGGGSLDDVLAAYPRLTLADVHGAMTYYYDNRAAIDREAANEVALAERFHQQLGPGPLESLRDEQGDVSATS